MKYLFYEGFVGTICFSVEDNLFYGEVLGINDSVSYQGETEEDLYIDYKNAIHDYINLCKKLGKPIEYVCKAL